MVFPPYRGKSVGTRNIPTFWRPIHLREIQSIHLCGQECPAHFTVAPGEVHSRWRSDLKPRQTDGQMDGRTFGPRLFSAVSPVTIRTCPTLCVTDEDLEDCVATHVSGWGKTGPPRQTKQALCMLGGGSLKPRSAFKETRGGRRRDWLNGAKKRASLTAWAA